MAQQDGVRSVGVEAPPRLVGHHHVRQRDAAVEREPAVGREGEELPVPRLVTG
jgi:hypothetical protein